MKIVSVLLLAVVISLGFSAPCSCASRDIFSSLDAIRAMKAILDMKDVPLKSLASDGSIADCVIMNEDVEEIIRRHAIRHYGGCSRSSVASAIDEIAAVLLAALDENSNQKLDGDEAKKLQLLADNNNGVFMLSCLAIVYSDMP